MKLLKQESKFTQVPNELLEDKNISLKAKGLYSYMYSKPENWNFTIKSMVKLLQDGERSITTALDELKNNDWIYYQKLSNGKGIYFIATQANAENLFITEILPKLQNVDLASKGSENPLVKPKLQNAMLAVCSRISNIVTINNITTTKEEEAEIKKDILSIEKDIDDIETEYEKFKDYNDYKFKSLLELKTKWERWINQVIKYNSKKPTNIPKKQKLITYELVDENIDKDMIMAFMGDNKIQRERMSQKIEEFKKYCVTNQKNYENYEDSFAKYLEIARQNGWNF